MTSTQVEPTRTGKPRPVHFPALHGEGTRCGKASLVGDPERNRVTCRQCLSILGPSWWRLQLERKPGDWIETPTVRKTIQRPRPLAYDASGRATRWVNVGGLERWG